MKNTLLIAAGLLALPTLAHAAGPITITFNDVPDGTVVNTFYSPLGVTFTGETPFSQQVQATTDGGAFSSNAMDATNGLVDILLSPNAFAFGLSTFQVTSLADPAGYGSKNVSFDFYNAAGTLLYSFSQFDQTKTQTFTISAGALQGVQKIVLPADAYYDNFTFQAAVPAAVPEAGTAVSFAALLALGGLTVLRRRQRAN